MEPEDANTDHSINLITARPRYYHRDGKPFVSNELMPDFLQWAMLFEQDRTVKKTRTLYGERLSTMWMGMDHSFFAGPPLIFETMLFAPRKHQRPIFDKTDEERSAAEAEDAQIERDYPHDLLQLRYTHEDDARERHQLLQLQCLVPPRWRRFLFYTIGRDETWS
jgi:hypothetical protein